MSTPTIRRPNAGTEETNASVPVSGPETNTKLQSRSSGVRVRASRVACLMTAIVLAVLAVYDVKVHVPANIFEPPGAQNSINVMNSFVPQGWAFFTKSPRDEGLRVYPVSDGTLGDHVQPANAEPGNTFGFDRGSRSQGTELGLLNAAVPEESWVSCEGPRQPCLSDALAAAESDDVVPTIPNTALITTICGRVVFSGEEPGPWAYRELVDDRWRSVRYAVVEVSC